MALGDVRRVYGMSSEDNGGRKFDLLDFGFICSSLEGFEGKTWGNVKSSSEDICHTSAVGTLFCAVVVLAAVEDLTMGLFAAGLGFGIAACGAGLLDSKSMI